MDYPYQILAIATPEGTISLNANVQMVVNAITAKTIAPFGNFGGPNVYWFETFNNGTGNLVYTVFDKDTTLGLASYTVRFGSAALIQQVIFEPFPRCEIELLHVILPNLPGITDQLNLPPPVSPVMQPVNIVPDAVLY